MKKVLTKSFFGLKLYYFIPFLLLALIAIILGSVMDKNISVNLARQGNPFGKFFETYGSILVTFIAPIGAGIMGKGMIRRENKGWVIFLGIVLSLAAGVLLVYFNYNDLRGKSIEDVYGFSLSKPLALLLSGLIMLGLYCVGYFLADKDEDPYRLAMYGIAILACFALFEVVANLVKFAAARPRYRFLAWDENEYTLDNFRAWWQFSAFHKLTTTNSDNIKSFPSGHTGGVATFMTLPILFRAFRFTKDKKAFEIGGVALAFVLVVVMAFARIVNGAHFLSDTGFGVLIAALSFLLVCWLMDLFTKRVPTYSFLKPDD